MAALIVLVNADPRMLRRVEARLVEEGHLVAAVTSFAAGRELLRSVNPDLVIADVQLDAYNGLHLAIFAHRQYPSVPVIITHSRPDPVFAAEAHRLGATFVDAPMSGPSLITTVDTLLSNRSDASQIRRWPRRSASVEVRAHVATHSARILDVSYGGIKLAFGAEPDVAGEFAVTLSAGLTVRAQRVWTSRSADNGELWCGAEVRSTEEDVTRAWRRFVDSVN